MNAVLTHVLCVFISVAALNASLRTRNCHLNEIQTAHLRGQHEKTQ